MLGSGGARGHAHIGAIRAIVERGHSIRNVAGTSMGALIGGMFAAGQLDTYESWAAELRKTDVVKLLDFSFTWTSIFKGDRIIGVLKELVGDRRIEDLDIGFTAVATALDQQKEVWLNDGSLFRAIRASIAVPGVFSPVRHDGMLLVDGGLVNPIPIAPTLNDSTDVTIAVNLAGVRESYRTPEPEPTDDSEDSAPEGYRAAISEFVSSLFENERGNTEEPHPDVAELLTKSIDAMQGSIARLKLAAYAPDIVVEIPRDSCTFFEFHRAVEMSDLGNRMTRKALEDAGL